jgi:hypothetical protein
MPSNSPVNVRPEILDILGELYIAYIGGGAHFSLCGECDLEQLGSISFYSPFFKQVLDCS